MPSRPVYASVTLVATAASTAIDVATAMNATRSRDRPARWRRFHVQDRLTTKLTAAPDTNAASVASRGPAAATWYTSGKTIALARVASSEPTAKRKSLSM